MADEESREAGTGKEGVKDKQPQAPTGQHVAVELSLSGGRGEGYKPQSPMNERGREMPDSNNLPQDSTWPL